MGAKSACSGVFSRPRPVTGRDPAPVAVRAAPRAAARPSYTNQPVRSTTWNAGEVANVQMSAPLASSGRGDGLVGDDVAGDEVEGRGVVRRRVRPARRMARSRPSPEARGETAIIDTISASTLPAPHVVATGRSPGTDRAARSPLPHVRTPSRPRCGCRRVGSARQPGSADRRRSLSYVPCRSITMCVRASAVHADLSVRRADLHQVGHDLPGDVVEVRHDGQSRPGTGRP